MGLPETVVSLWPHTRLWQLAEPYAFGSVVT
jgi:hypothetical protein